MNKALVRLINFQQVNTDLINVCLISIIWIAMIILVNPIGNFPLNDDWAYGWTVKTLLETGNFQLSDWAAANLLPQALWGTLFCLPFGFSFTALRFSTLLLGLFGAIASYGLLRETKASSQISLLGSLGIVLNPIYFGLSNSFATDIPSFTLCILAVYFLARGVRLNSINFIVFGLIFSFIAILNRQSSLFILPAFGVAYLARQGFTLKTFVKASLPTLIGILIYLAYSHWLDSTGRTPLLYGFQIQRLKDTLSGGIKAAALNYGENAWLFSIYLGLFLFPFLVLKFPQIFKTFSTQQKRISLYLTLFLISIGIISILNRKQMPLIGNTLVELGLGPLSVYGYNSFQQEHQFLYLRLVHSCWALITLLSLTGASILIQYFLITIKAFIKYRVNFSQTWLIVFLITASFLYLFPIGGINKDYWFDRYLIIPLPLVMASILALIGSFYRRENLNPRTTLSVCAMLLCLGAFTITATHDYLTWNRVRWLALDNLMAHSKVLPNQISGGFEFSGWHLGNRIEICNPKFQRSATNIHSGWEDFSCLWDYELEYKVSFIPQPGYQQKALYSFQRWLPWKEEILYILHKDK